MVSAIRDNSLNSPQNLACGNLSAITQCLALRDRKHSISESDRRLKAQKEGLKPSFSRQYAGVCDLLTLILATIVQKFKLELLSEPPIVPSPPNTAPKRLGCDVPKSLEYGAGELQHRSCGLGPSGENYGCSTLQSVADNRYPVRSSRHCLYGDAPCHANQ